LKSAHAHTARETSGLPSRNRAFALHTDPDVRRTRRALRLLDAIHRDLDRPGIRATLRLRPIRLGGQRRIRLEYENPVLHCARTAYLTPEELARLRALVSESNGRLRLRSE
jgi:hypothetical protein